MSQAFEVIQPQSTPTTTIIEFLLDETGSMCNARDATIGSFNEYINSQKRQDGECFISLTMFDDRGIRTQYTDVNVQDVQELTRDGYSPNGMTNLYDAVGSRIGALEHRSKGKPPASKLIVIMTDGQDNCSKEFTSHSLKQLVSEREADGWTFVFLGANQDAWKVGQQFGMAKGNTMTYSTENMVGTMDVLAKATTSYRSVRASGLVGNAEAATDFFSNVNDVKAK